MLLGCCLCADVYKEGELATLGYMVVLFVLGYGLSRRCSELGFYYVNLDIIGLFTPLL